MVEELKVIADILKGVSESAVNGVIAYLVFAYMKPVTLMVVGCFTIVKSLGVVFNKKKKMIEVIDSDSL